MPDSAAVLSVRSLCAGRPTPERVAPPSTASGVRAWKAAATAAASSASSRGASVLMYGSAPRRLWRRFSNALWRRGCESCRVAPVQREHFGGVHQPAWIEHGAHAQLLREVRLVELVAHEV